jgi:hypothetical protein
MCIKIQAVQEKLRLLLRKTGRLIVYCLNKYTIKSINSKGSIQARNPQSAHVVDWPGETYNGGGF